MFTCISSTINSALFQITDKIKMYEQLLDETLDTAPIGICMVERDRQNLRIMDVNLSLMHMLKKEKPIPDYIGTPLAEFWEGQDISALVKKLRGLSPPKEYTLPINNDDEDETRRWAKISVSETLVNNKEAYILWVMDISSNKKSEEALKQAVEEADAAAEMKANFLATMSHEIRTPMQSVFGILELIAEEKPPQNIMDMVNIAKNSASGLLEILDDILDIAKMDADKMDLDVFEVPIRTLARGVLEALSVRVHGKDIKLVDDISEDVPFVVIGDPKRLRQILMNLAGNATKFTEKGEVRVTINTDVKHIEQPEKGVALRFEISDTGIGMSDEACSRLFQPFIQADSSTARKFGGTGLGLSICKKLVELMGGKIGVYSEEGKGSTFWFEIPTQEISVNATELEMPNLEGISVLSVEDHPAGAKEIVNSLRSMGANVESVPTYKEALKLVKRRPFDVGIIDQGLPDGVGVDLIKEIIKIRPFMGLIMYTVRDDAGLQHLLKALGVQYISKPASRLGLGEAVKDAASQSTKISIDGPTKLLIAEDTASVRDILSRQLKSLGVEADFVENGKDALKAIETGKYGILFTDLHMPEIDGYEVVDTIRRKEKEQGEKGQHFPTIVLTADVQMSQRQTYMNYGFDECLLKPISLGQIKRLLIRWGLLKDDGKNISSASKKVIKDNQKKKEKNKDKDKDKNILLPPAIDKDAVVEQMGAFDEISIEMIQMFVEMTEPLIDKIKKALEEENISELTELGHSLKGGARSACCPRLGDLAAEIQKDGEEGKFNTNIINDCIKEFERVKKEASKLS